MNKMSAVMSIRFPPLELELIEEMASAEKIDKSTAVRELVEMGRVYFAISRYKEGKISIEKAAEIANLSLSEMIDLLASLGIKSKIEMEDYVAGAKAVQGIFR